jgi:hypothetical protein
MSWYYKYKTHIIWPYTCIMCIIFTLASTCGRPLIFHCIFCALNKMHMACYLWKFWQTDALNWACNRLMTRTWAEVVWVRFQHWNGLLNYNFLEWNQPLNLKEKEQECHYVLRSFCFLFSYASALWRHDRFNLPCEDCQSSSTYRSVQPCRAKSCQGQTYFSFILEITSYSTPPTPFLFLLLTDSCCVFSLVSSFLYNHTMVSFWMLNLHTASQLLERLVTCRYVILFLSICRCHLS